MANKQLTVRQAPFALRVVQRTGGTAAIVYRRRADANGRERLTRLAAISPLAFTAGLTLLRRATGQRALAPGPWYPMAADWGVRVGCYALVTSGLRNADGIARAAGHFQGADPDDAAWWLGMLTNGWQPTRVLRALRILTEATE